jgi:hypothetical protein
LAPRDAIECGERAIPQLGVGPRTSSRAILDVVLESAWAIISVDIASLPPTWSLLEREELVL